MLGGLFESSNERPPFWKIRAAVRKMAKCLFPAPTLSSDFAVKNGQWLSFAQVDGSPALVHVLDGVSHPEQSFMWTLGPKLVLAFAFKKGKTLSLSLRYKTFLPKERVVAHVGDRIIADITLAGEGETTFLVPCDGPSMEGLLVLTFDLPDAISPAEVLGTADTRRIALRLLALKGKWLSKGEVACGI
jgi:hypothetical protein